ncbi:two-component system, LytTR family, sensor histidine kinase AgrC [Enterococcus sp. AZ194]|uniref:sensor histidine kinase n=1 Tax=Enterococcus sp. AZ194 TaxID=2774629 RepID=UPI003F207D09
MKETIYSFVLQNLWPFQSVGVFLSHLIQILLISFLLNETKKWFTKIGIAILVAFIFMRVATWPQLILWLGVFGWNSVIILCTMMVYGLYFSSIRKQKVRQFLLAFTFAYAVYYLSDFFVSYIATALFSQGKYVGYIMILPTILVFLPMLAIYGISKRIKLNETLTQIMRYKWIVWIVLASLVIVIATINYVLILSMDSLTAFLVTGESAALSKTTNDIFLILFIVFSAVLVLIWFSSYLFMNMEKVEQQKNELIQQQLYIQKLEGLQTEMRAVRHDYKNIISGIYLQAKEGDSTSVQEYLANTMNQLDEQISSSIMLSSQLANLKVMELKSLLLVKLMELENETIRYTIEVPYPIDFIKMDISDFTRCLGILIDNAKEEVRKQPDGSLSILLLNEPDELNVMVKNTIIEKPLLKKIWEEGYSTKGSNRGLGLSSYQRILTRYEFVLKQTFIQEQEFIQIFSLVGRMS